uniref:Uncharacterized protein n=1 Tax=Romanomermis culicivorax TaxID=13658 RepID=A0A915J2X3_ROMCU
MLQTALSFTHRIRRRPSPFRRLPAARIFSTRPPERTWPIGLRRRTIMLMNQVKNKKRRATIIIIIMIMIR